MIQSDAKLNLPTSAELPDSDETPADNEEQNFLPNLLDTSLRFLWQNRSDWFLGIDMGIYHTTGINPRIPIVPDGFLSLGVERRKKGRSRPSYVVWEEQDIVPSLVIEIVSQTYGGEYDQKQEIYAKLGILYYLVYNSDHWKRDKHAPFELYRLVTGSYELQDNEPFWMPEIGLGIGIRKYQLGVDKREILSWFNEQKQPYLTPEEMLEQYRQRFGEL